MARLRVKMNSQGARELINSLEVQDELLDYAQLIATRAGTGHEADVQAGKNRAHARAVAVTSAAMAANRSKNVLLKALGGQQGD